MRRLAMPWLTFLALAALAGCATRPVNPPLAQYQTTNPLEIRSTAAAGRNPENLVILAFSGGGTRAAAFSYGVLETLRRTEITRKDGTTVRLLDQVDAITGVSGGSFTALAYGLYGERLFDIYPQAFLKRNVQGELIGRALDPLNWGSLASTGWGRSELAADLYDEILFHGATFDDLRKAGGPLVAVSATDLSTGSRLVFLPQNFNVLCAELGPVRLSRAAAASSAVPVVLSAVTLNNYGGSCGYTIPPELARFATEADPPRPAARLLSRLNELQEFSDGAANPYLHLVDGGVSDNLGLRSVLDLVQSLEALHEAGIPTPLDHVRRIIVIVVNSLSEPATDWNRSEEPPGLVDTLIKASGVPIDRYSGESVEQLKDIAARWKMLRQIRDSVAFTRNADAAVAYVNNVPDADLFAIDVSFPALQDKAERAYLNQLPTSFVLPDEAVDRLRAAAAKIILDSPDFQRVLQSAGAPVVPLGAGPIADPADR